MGSDAEKLTPSQRAAAEYAGGPLIVLAGPGTGKTRTMVHRIAHQIQVRGIEPRHIVAMTFTVKAANQLREKLSAVVSESVAAGVNAHTIHGFGHKLARRFRDVLGLPDKLELIDTAQSNRLLRRIITERKLFSDSRGVGLSSLVEELREAFECLGNLGVLPGQCREFGAAWKRKLDGAKGDSVEADRVRCARFADTAAAYSEYTEECTRLGWVGYSDFATLPIRLLRENPGAVAMCRDDYRAFIVDEFQDCNPGQIELLRLLCPAKADLCVVGDDDQAIYRFRGADEQAFARFDGIWPRREVIDLSENFRSGPEVITVSNAVIAKSGKRFRPDKKVAPPRENARVAKATIDAVKLENEAQDAEVIAAMILADRAESKRPWKSYAVIARGHADLDRVSGALRVEGVPFERVREKAQFEDAGVEDVEAWIEWLLDPDATWAARRVLTRPPYGLSPGVVTQWELEFRAQGSQAAAGRKGTQAPGKFVDWIEARAGDHKGPAAIAAAKHRALSVATATARGDEAVHRIILGCDAAHAELLPGRARARRITALLGFLALAREKQSRLEGAGDLRELWLYLDELRGSGGVLPQSRTLNEALDSDEPTSAEGEADDGRVQLLTAHSAKGLEFDTVFVTRVNPAHGFPSSKSDDSWQPPQGLCEAMDSRSDQERRADEERRLFYVACTRAERRLVLLAKWNKNASKSTHFFEELVRVRSDLPIKEHLAAEVLKAAAEQGVGLGGRSLIEQAAADAGVRERLAETTQRIRRQSRLEASMALEALERPDLSAQQLNAAADRLRLAAGRMAAAAQADATGGVPPWLLDAQPELGPLATKLGALAKAQVTAKGESPASVLLRPIQPPLSLNYTVIDAYQRCPRCFYLGQVMRLPEAQTQETGVGIIAHGALEVFFKEWAKADADGRPTPGLERLLGLAKERYVSSLYDTEQVNAEVLDQLEAQMKLVMTRLHTDRPHIVETECSLEFEYELDKRTHHFTAKIDRIDLLPDGGVRIIDYKTGNASKKYTEPAKSDLQLGIYALALKLSKGHGWAPGGTLKGVAEYWCLATGQRGSIALEALDEKKVRSEIDEAARGMLDGHFEAKPRCDGPCRIFGD